MRVCICVGLCLCVSAVLSSYSVLCSLIVSLSLLLIVLLHAIGQSNKRVTYAVDYVQPHDIAWDPVCFLLFTFALLLLWLLLIVVVVVC